MLTIRAMSNGAGYAARHLEHSDYYAEGHRVLGQWHGRAAEMLGLEGEVRSREFEAVREGLDPTTGEFLRQRQSADRLAPDGSTQSRGRSLYDFTFSAPKSVSILATVGGDERLVEAHAKAVAEALGELEVHAAARVRKAGANEDRSTGNLLLAVYHHDTSRELDPQLHSHAVAANLTYDGEEGRWKALQASGIYDHRAYLTEVYRNALAREVRTLGYQVEDRRDRSGRDLGFDLQGVPDDLLKRYSQRSRQRDEAIAAFTERTGRKPSDNEVAVLVRETRQDKLTEISTAEVRGRQQERLEPGEARLLAGLHQDALQLHDALHASRDTSQSLSDPTAALSYARDHIFERVSVAPEQLLLTEALRHGRGRLDLSQLQGAMGLEEASGRMLRAEGELATRQSLDRERDTVARIDRGLGRFEALGGDSRFVASDRLRPEQKHAVEFLLGSRDLAVNLRGAAGTGKTATLRELKRGLEEGGREILAVAPTMSAVEELKAVGFTNAVTVARLLADPQMAATIAGKAVIVDEAGMLSGRQMAELVHLGEDRRARLIFSGDTRQIQSVEASDALRVLEQESRLKSVSLTQVQRQTAPGYREAVEELRRNPSRGFTQLDAMSAVQEVAFADRAQAVAAAYREAQHTPNAAGLARSVLVVAATHEEIGRVTEAIRADRRGRGELGEGTMLDRHVALNSTAAQKAQPRHYRAGQLVTFHRATKDAAKGETVEVSRVHRGRVFVRPAGHPDGAERELSPRQAQSFDLYERHSIEVAAGDTLLLGANRRKPGFRAVNGELVTVARVAGSGRVELEDGRTLPADYRQFSHGYAVTAHRSQGKSVDTVVISADAMKRELFYVAASRGRETIAIVTSDKDALRSSIARSGARQSASELARKLESKPELQHRRKGLHSGLTRGFTAARDLARHWAQHYGEHLARYLPRRKEQEQVKTPELERAPEIARQHKLSQSITREHDHGHGFSR